MQKITHSNATVFNLRVTDLRFSQLCDKTRITIPRTGYNIGTSGPHLRATFNY